ncbi:MAG: pentapeptide repeat-containing protein [Actinomycetota bacterium]
MKWLRRRAVLVAGASAVIVLILAAIVVFPGWIVGGPEDGEDRLAVLKAENDVRGTLLAGIAGGFFLVTAFLSWRQIQVTREGQITDRFATAVEQLGRRAKEGERDPLDVRLGGIYALERVANDSAADRRTVVDVLAAFVREHSPAKEPEAAEVLAMITAISRDQSPAKEPEAAEVLAAFVREHSPAKEPEAAEVLAAFVREHSPAKEREAAEPASGRPDAIPTDVQACITVLGRINPGPEHEINLHRANLNRARSSEVDLRGANLVGASLIRASMREANLSGANLFGADLRGARLVEANLSRANLRGADLRAAELFGADMRGADVIGARLGGAWWDERTRWPEGFTPPAPRVVGQRGPVEE